VFLSAVPKPFRSAFSSPISFGFLFFTDYLPQRRTATVVNHNYPTPPVFRMCGRERTCGRVILYVWQRKDLGGHSLDVWQRKNLPRICRESASKRSCREWR
jgi:hypothetical protein